MELHTIMSLVMIQILTSYFDIIWTRQWMQRVALSKAVVGDQPNKPDSINVGFGCLLQRISWQHMSLTGHSGQAIIGLSRTCHSVSPHVHWKIETSVKSSQPDQYELWAFLSKEYYLINAPRIPWMCFGPRFQNICALTGKIICYTFIRSHYLLMVMKLLLNCWLYMREMQNSLKSRL